MISLLNDLAAQIGDLSGDRAASLRMNIGIGFQGGSGRTQY